MARHESSMDERVRLIAGQELHVRSLELQGRDALDFYECHVSNLKRALQKAFIAGYRAAQEGEAAPIDANEVDSFIEYLCVGNSKEDLAVQLIEMLPLQVLDDIRKSINDFQEYTDRYDREE